MTLVAPISVSNSERGFHFCLWIRVAALPASSSRIRFIGGASAKRRNRSGKLGIVGGEIEGFPDRFEFYVEKLPEGNFLLDITNVPACGAQASFEVSHVTHNKGVSQCISKRVFEPEPIINARRAAVIPSDGPVETHPFEPQHCLGFGSATSSLVRKYRCDVPHPTNPSGDGCNRMAKQRAIDLLAPKRIPDIVAFEWPALLAKTKVSEIGISLQLNARVSGAFPNRVAYR